MPNAASFGLAHLWSQSDMVIKAVAFILVIMSIASWSIILVRTIQQARARKTDDAIESFWLASNLDEGLARLSSLAPHSPFEALAYQGVAATEHVRAHALDNTLGSKLNTEEFITRAMRKSISLSTAKIESGLTVLASIGSTAPFIGLLGTVWGIYGALINISASGSATLDKVAGPVGEALIMTAFGLFVAIPAVLAYNAFARINRLMLSELDAFAHDLHAWLTTGTRLATAPGAKRKPSGNSLRNQPDDTAPPPPHTRLRTQGAA